MTTFVAWLRAVNVGGTGKLPMSRLVELAQSIGLEAPRTYIQSGNLIFRSKRPRAKIRADLERALGAAMGKPASVSLRTLSELEACLEGNPFQQEPGPRVIVMFYEEAPSSASVRAAMAASAATGERLELRGLDLYVYYPNGQGTSKLKVPSPGACTGRNINTVTKVHAIACEIDA